MTVVLLAFILGLALIFLGLMALGGMVYLWPLSIIVGMWLIYRDHRARRNRRC